MLHDKSISFSRSFFYSCSPQLFFDWSVLELEWNHIWLWWHNTTRAKVTFFSYEQFVRCKYLEDFYLIQKIVWNFSLFFFPNPSNSFFMILWFQDQGTCNISFKQEKLFPSTHIGIQFDTQLKAYTYVLITSMFKWKRSVV